MAGLELVGVTKKRGDITVVDGVDLAVQDGEFVAVLAPPGHGKTTLLRLIAGLEAPDAGDIILDDVSIVDRPVQTRGIGMVFEDLAVFPHWSGFDNLAHPLKIARVDQEEITERVFEVARMLGIEVILDRMPGTYSGGEQQRVAIGRALIRRPDLLLMDQPLTDLDALIRQEMTVELKRLQQETGQTIVYATHDFEEAMGMADRVAILEHGRVVQTASPERVYAWPATEHAAGAMGNPQMNLLPCSVVQEEGRLLLKHPAFSFEPNGWESQIGERTTVRLGIRPEDIRLAEPNEAAQLGSGVVSAQAVVEVVQYLGDERIVDISVADDRLKVVAPWRHDFAIGDSATVAWDEASVRLFDVDTRRALHDDSEST
jgi:inositol-phosphate transport system ATP-binding protein